MFDFAYETLVSFLRSERFSNFLTELEHDVLIFLLAKLRDEVSRRMVKLQRSPKARKEVLVDATPTTKG